MYASEILPLDLRFCHLDELSFRIAFYELAHGPSSYDLNRIETLLPNLLDQTSFSLSFDFLDLDTNFPLQHITMQ